MEIAYLAKKPNAWEDLGRARGGWELLNQSMEARERHRHGGGEIATAGVSCL